jgi:hypothetical protein
VLPKWPASRLANHRFHSFWFAQKLLPDHTHRYNFFINHHEFRRHLRQQQRETSLGSVLDLCNGNVGNGLEVFHDTSSPECAACAITDCTIRDDC